MTPIIEHPVLRGALRATPLAALLARFRSAVRTDESGLIFISVVIGIVAGALVVALRESAALLHGVLYHLTNGGALSATSALESPWFALVPALGGLALGFSGRLIATLRSRRPVDPIEANALQGGRMSVVDSLIIGFQTLLSNGFGASVGLEAAYTQLGSGFASWLGRSFRMRRSDMRMLVGAGSAAAIGAAFNAPLTGAFYAFELIIGTYSPFGLAPVVAASIAGVLVGRALEPSYGFIGPIASSVPLQGGSMAALLLLALLCAGFGIAVMRVVALVETRIRNSRVPAALQPALGGLGLGLLALVTPHVLSSGHSAFAEMIHGGEQVLAMLALTILLKATASVISIGCGFRGGLFFASLYLGGMIGKLFFALAVLVAPGLGLDATTSIVVGMASLSVAIIGGPLTMSFLALEATGDFPLSILILAAATLVSVLVRRTFGYSFATWRLHLRGESIRSAQDVGWIRSLTVRRLMRHDVETAFADSSIGSFLQNHPLGSAYWIAATDPFGRYAGLVSLSEAHALTMNAEKCRQPLTMLLHYTTTVLTPDMNIREAARMFEKSESEALAVVESSRDRRVAGLLTEAHLLRRYSEELDKVRKDLSGETWMGEAEAPGG